MSYITPILFCAGIFLFSGAGVAHAQSTDGNLVRQVLQARCNTGDQAACISLRAAEHHLEHDNAGQEGATVAVSDSSLATQPVVADPQQDADPASDTVPAYWKWILVGLIGWLIFRGIVRAFAKLKDSDLPPSEVLDRPAIRLGPRTIHGIPAEQMDLQDHQVVPWDRGPIMAWIDAEMKAVRDQVKNKDLLRLCDEKCIVMSLQTRIPRLAATYLVEDKLLGVSSEISGKNPDLYYLELAATRLHMPGSAYSLAHMAWTARNVTDTEIIVSLFRLDADMDFQPAVINMLAYCKQKGIGDCPPLPWAMREAYLRHHFDIGAPDGHSELAAALGIFYMWDATNRADDGYVAAAVRRLLHYGDPLRQEMLQRSEEWPDAWDLSDNSVSTDGWMHDQNSAQDVNLH